MKLIIVIDDFYQVAFVSGTKRILLGVLLYFCLMLFKEREDLLRFCFDDMLSSRYIINFFSHYLIFL